MIDKQESGCKTGFLCYVQNGKLSLFCMNMNIEELPDESDSSDEDYVPGAKPEEQVSEVESDGDPEDPLSDAEDTSKATNSSKGKKRRKRSNQARKKTKTTTENTEESMLFVMY